MKKSLIIYFSILTVFMASAQSTYKTVVAAAGSSMSTSKVHISYTIGEPVVGLITDEGVVDQGFWAGLLRVENSAGQKSLEGIIVYPNPVVNEVTIFSDSNEIFGITLFAVDGRKVLHQKVEDDFIEHRIDLSYVTKGVYILRLFVTGDAEGKLFKIIKE